MLLHYTVSVVLPLYKPADNWISGFIKNVRELDRLLTHESVEYIIVHDGPADKHLLSGIDIITGELPHVRFISYHENKGKGYAVRTGVAASTGLHILMIDFDFPYQKENIKQLLSLLHTGKDIVVGKRTRRYFLQAPLKRTIVSKLFYTLNLVFLPLPLYDTQSGIKGFNHAGKKIFLQTMINRFLVDTEFLLRAHKSRACVAVINVHLQPGIKFSNFGMNVLKTELKNFIYLVRLNRLLRKTSMNHSMQIPYMVPAQ
jgi:dolichyl-phosphate beta-glucosyltransferase